MYLSGLDLCLRTCNTNGTKQSIATLYDLNISVIVYRRFHVKVTVGGAGCSVCLVLFGFAFCIEGIMHCA